MEFNVELDKLINSTVLNFFLASPKTISNDKLTELCSPVAEVVDSDAFVACELVKLLKRMTYDGSSEMANVEGLRNVGRGIVENDSLAVTVFRGAILLALSEHFAESIIGKRSAFDSEVQISVYSFRTDNLIITESLGKCRGDLYGRSSENLAELETRESDIAHCGIRRIFK